METVFNQVAGWFSEGGPQLTLIEKVAKSIIILILVNISIKICYKFIDNFFNGQKKLKFGMADRKADTLSIILKSLIKYIIYFIGILPILEQFGIQTKSILATAGVGGLAIGFGAKSLVEDIISGFFILFEDQYAVGDYIQTGSFDGVVEELGLRVTKLRAFSGDLHIIPNGNIQTVTNRSRGNMRAWVDVRIPYSESIDKAIGVLEEVSKLMAKKHKNITHGPTVLGVTNLGPEDVVLSLYAMTKPMDQWEIERSLKKNVKEAFEKEGISINNVKRFVVESSEDHNE